MHQALRLQASQLWQKHPRESIALGLLAFAGSVILAGTAWSTPTIERVAKSPGQLAAAPPAPPPLLVRELPRGDALAINRAIPIDSGPNPAAKPFSLGKADDATRAQALECLTSAVYYEAATEGADGQRAVAQVVLNRVRHPAFPASVCGVVYEGSSRATGCQFTFTCDGSLARRPVPALWDRARTIAWAALSGTVFKPVGNATHYHADYVVPYWASSLTKNAVVGAHIFYRWAGGWGRPNAFSMRYVEREPDASALRTAAAEAEITAAETEEAVAEIPGAEALPEPVAIEDGKRVALRFNLQAREAVEAAPRTPYVEEVAASDNLRWSLSGGSAESRAKPLGRSTPAAESPNQPGATSTASR